MGQAPGPMWPGRVSGVSASLSSAWSGAGVWPGSEKIGPVFCLLHGVNSTMLSQSQARLLK